MPTRETTNGENIIAQNVAEQIAAMIWRAAQIAAIQVVNIEQSDIDRGEQCSVCLEEFKVNEKAKKLECNHKFHPKCISPWLRIHGICPTCRHEEFRNDADSDEDSEEESDEESDFELSCCCCIC